MTIKEASVKFNLDEKEIRKRKKDDMIFNVRTENRVVVISDDTEIIPSKKDIRSFLLQIIKIKNNSSTIISRNLCPDNNSLKILLRYLYKRGFIGEFSEVENDQQMLNAVSLTDSGIEYVFGSQNYSKLNTHVSLPLNINIVNIDL